MLNQTRKFYNLTKLDKSLEESEREAPPTWIKVFYKEYPRLPSRTLPAVRDEGEFEELLRMRESRRIFSDNPLKLEELSQILGSCRIVDADRQPEKRTYPSGGARFPVELYLLAFNVKDIEEGAYHYNMKDNKLETLWEKDLKPFRREIISPYLENPAATIVFTSVISRSEVKYGPRAYPFSFIEAGHMGQNILLKATEIGIDSCPVSGFIDDRIKKILDLTDAEIPIYSINVGKRKRL